jgi:hypothetical protein
MLGCMKLICALVVAPTSVLQRVSHRTELEVSERSHTHTHTHTPVYTRAPPCQLHAV